MNDKVTSVEVAPAEGGWSVTIHYSHQDGGESIGTYRLKHTAFLTGRGAAMAHHTELRVKNRKGHYTDKGASYGNDPRESKG